MEILRTRSTLYCSLLLMASLLGFADDTQVQVGMLENDLLELREEPDGRMSVGNKTIYKWQDLEAWVQNGKVSKLRKRRPQSPELLRQQAIRQAQANLERQNKQRIQAEAVQRQNIAHSQKYAQDRQRRAQINAMIEAEVSRWEVTKKEIERKGYKYGKRREWQNLYEQYINAYKKEKEALLSGNRNLEKAYAQSRSRFELQLNKLTDETLDKDTINIRQEHYTR